MVVGFPADWDVGELRRYAQRSGARDIAGITMFLRGFQETDDDRTEPAWTRAIVKRGHRVSDEFIEQVRVSRFSRDDAAEFDNPYCAADFGYRLNHGPTVVGTVGFIAEREGITVVQVQGGLGARPHKYPLNWHKGLVRRLFEEVREYGVSTARMLSADKHPWVQIAGHLDYEGGRRMYDWVARACNMRRNSDTIFEKRLAH